MGSPIDMPIQSISTLLNIDPICRRKEKPPESPEQEQEQKQEQKILHILIVDDMNEKYNQMTQNLNLILGKSC